MSDSYTPFGLAQVVPVVNADGTVGWQFLGGINLAESFNPLTQVASQDQSVSWGSAKDPLGYSPEMITGGGDTLGLIATYIPGRPLQASVELLAMDNTQSTQAELSVNGDGSITCGGSHSGSRTLIGADGISDIDGAPGDVIWSAATSRRGSLACNGQAVPRTGNPSDVTPGYSKLFAQIGTTFGAGDGVHTFNVPNIQSRTIVGAGTGPGLSTRAFASTGGEELHTLDTNEIPSINTGYVSSDHSHNLTAWATAGPSDVSNVRVNLGSTYNVPWSNSAGFSSWYSPTTGISANHYHNVPGGGLGHNNMQPYIVLNAFIVY